MLPGHLAVPTVLKRYVDLETVPLFVGSFFPDLVDKTLEEMEWIPNGRNIAHTLFSLAVTTVWVERIGGRANAISWATGYLGHLICDVSGLVPWFYPFVAYKFKPNHRYTFWHKVKRAITRASPLEWALVIWAVTIAFDLASKKLRERSNV